MPSSRTRCFTVSFLLAVTIFVITAFGNVGLVFAQEAKSAPALSLEAVTVTPSSPGADTLCQLKVAIKNNGEQIASLLAFTVKVGGQKLPVYDTELFALPLAAGETTEISLFNFWTSETGRPAPKDGNLSVEVALTEAQWMKVGMDGEVEVWTPTGEIGGLPVTKSVTLKMGK